MTSGGITFDFHNTIASCDAWFQLEVYHLVSSFLTWHEAAGFARYTREQLTGADRVYRSLRQEIHVHGEEQTAEQCVRTVLSEIDIDVAEDEIEQGVLQLMLETAPLASPMDGVIETIASLSASGVPLGIVSSAVYHPFLEWTLDRFGIQHAFQAVITSASSGFYKSRPEIYQTAADALGIPAERIVHVGDSLRFDVGGAQRIGMRTVFVNNNPKPPAEDDPTPDLHLTSLSGAAPAILQVLHGQQ